MTASITSARTRREELNLPYTHVDDFYINGQWIKAVGDKRNPVVDPAIGEQWGSVPEATPEELDTTVAAARSALTEWGAFRRTACRVPGENRR